MQITIHGHTIWSIQRRLEKFADAVFSGSWRTAAIPCPGFNGDETCVEELTHDPPPLPIPQRARKHGTAGGGAIAASSTRTTHRKGDTDER